MKRSSLTEFQAGVLGYIRQHGPVDTKKFNHLEAKSLAPLVRKGFIRFSPCGECIACTTGRGECFNQRAEAVPGK